jgi:hypothetical protein
MTHIHRLCPFFFIKKLSRKSTMTNPMRRHHKGAMFKMYFACCTHFPLPLQNKLRCWKKSVAQYSLILDQVFYVSIGSRTRDREKAEPGLVKKIADPAIFNQPSGKSVSIFPRGSRGPEKNAKKQISASPRF